MNAKHLPSMLLCLFVAITVHACVSGPTVGTTADPMTDEGNPVDEPATVTEQTTSAEERVDETDPLCGYSELSDVGEEVVSAHFNHNGNKQSLTLEETMRLSSILRATVLGNPSLNPPGWRAKLVVETESDCAVELALVPGALEVDARYPTDDGLPDVLSFKIPWSDNAPRNAFDPGQWLIELHESYLGPPTQWPDQPIIVVPVSPAPSTGSGGSGGSRGSP